MEEGKGKGAGKCGEDKVLLYEEGEECPTETWNFKCEFSRKPLACEKKVQSLCFMLSYPMGAPNRVLKPQSASRGSGNDGL